MKRKYVAPILVELEVSGGKCSCQCGCGILAGSGGGAF